ncbi:MAG: SRPBCC family protein [Streptosporangiaceae bacterium]
MPASLIVTAGVTVAASPEQVWDLAVDWSRQGEWIWATRSRGGRGAGAAVTARTGLGRAGFTDTMLITEWDPPRRCTVTHTGAIVRGEGIFEVRPLGPDRSEFRWSERIVLPEPVADLIPAGAEAAVTRLAYAVIAPLARAGLGSSLARFARLASSGLAGPGPPVRVSRARLAGAG